MRKAPTEATHCVLDNIHSCSSVCTFRYRKLEKTGKDTSFQCAWNFSCPGCGASGGGRGDGMHAILSHRCPYGEKVGDGTCNALPSREHTVLEFVRATGVYCTFFC